MSSNFNPRSLVSPGPRLGRPNGRKLSNIDFVITYVKKNGPTNAATLSRELSKFTGSKGKGTGYGYYFYTPSKNASKQARDRTRPGIGVYWTRTSDGTMKLTSKGAARATMIFNESRKNASSKRSTKTSKR